MATALRHRLSTSPVDPEAPCAHCGLPVGPHPVGTDPAFCCTGCRVVYNALHTAGFDATFYRLRDLAPDHTSRPARTAADPLQLSELDTEAFLAEHTQPTGDGTRRVELFLDGVHCAACVWLAERLPYELDGILDARLDLPRARLSLRFDPARVHLSEAAHWLARFGYAAHPARQAGLSQRTDAEHRLLIKMGVCWALAGNVMLIAFALYSGLSLATDATLATGARWASLVLSTLAVGYGGSEFFRRAWASLRVAVRARQLHALHMDTPIALGILVGFGHSAWATISGHGEVWFDSITVLIAALLTARWLQLRSRRLAGDATDRLLSLIPSMARRVRKDGTVETIRIDDVQPGDVIEVPAGEVFPIDGVIATGQSLVNNAVLTGESRPESIAPGTAVAAGATNLSAPVRVRAEAAGPKTRIGRLLAWIRNQESKQADVVLLADRLSGYFVVGVLALALVTALIWLSLEPSQAAAHVVALLVISCPCALGMATPLAMAVASGRAARAGIFIKSDAAIQQLTRVDVVVLDKTGTLTEGRMTLAEYIGDEESLDLAAALETQSNHPIAAALVQARTGCTLNETSHGLPAVDACEAVAGQGLHGWVDDHAVVVGRPTWVERRTGALPPAYREALDAFAASGYTPVAVAVDGRCTAALAFGDPLRTDSRPVIDALHASGRAVYLLSGDHPDVVQSVAARLGLPADHAFGGFSPEGKRSFINLLRRNHGHTVAMIGDGVNDAAALHAADVGIAVQGGATPSLVAADVFLTGEGLMPVAGLLTGARHVMRVIRSTLGFSLFYNLAGATAALLGLVTPLIAAIAMPASSLVVVTAAVLQRSFRPSVRKSMDPRRRTTG